MFDSALHFEDVLNIKLLLLFFSHSVVSDSATPWTAALQAFLSFTISQSLLKLMPIEPVMPSKHLILCHPFLLLPSIFPSIRVFSNELVLSIRWPKYQSFSFSINPSNEYSGLICFTIGWISLPSKGLSRSPPAPQFKSINSLLLSLPYGPILTSVHDYWKNHRFDHKTFVGKVMSLLFNMLSWSQIQVAGSIRTLVQIRITTLALSGFQGTCDVCYQASQSSGSLLGHISFPNRTKVQGQTALLW